MNYKEINGFDYPYYIFEDGEIYYIKNNKMNLVKIYVSDKKKKNNKIVYLIKDKKSHIYSLDKLINKHFSM
jgi:hypothetical protein